MNELSIQSLDPAVEMFLLFSVPFCLSDKHLIDITHEGETPYLPLPPMFISFHKKWIRPSIIEKIVWWRSAFKLLRYIVESYLKGDRVVVPWSYFRLDQILFSDSPKRGPKLQPKGVSLFRKAYEIV